MIQSSVKHYGESSHTEEGYESKCFVFLKFRLKREKTKVLFSLPSGIFIYEISFFLFFCASSFLTCSKD